MKVVLLALMVAGVCNGLTLMSKLEKDFEALQDALAELRKISPNHPEENVLAADENVPAPEENVPAADANVPAEDDAPPAPPIDDVESEMEELDEAISNDKDDKDPDEGHYIDQTNDKVPDHLTKFLEGDILLTPAEKAELKMRQSGKAVGSDAIRNTRLKWTGAVMPYRLAGIDSRGQSALRQAIAEYAAKTCIVIRPYRSGDRNYVNLIKGGGCYSYIGMLNQGAQTISIGNGCQYKATVVHEIMHALGFWHEQSRLDRDQYITVGWSNMNQAMRSQFKKVTNSQAQTFNYPYDLVSVMQYHNTAFSANGRNTMTAKSNPRMRLGQPPSGGLSDIDAKTLNALYCGGKSKTGGGGGSTGGNGGGSTGTDKGGAVCEFFKSRPQFCTSPLVKANCASACRPKCNQVDKNSNCPGWAGKYCNDSKYKKYMSVNCKKSCKIPC